MSAMQQQLRVIKPGTEIRAYIHGREFKGAIAPHNEQPGGDLVLLIGVDGPIILDTSKIEAFTTFKLF